MRKRLSACRKSGRAGGSAGIKAGRHTHPAIRLLVSPSKAEGFGFTTVSVLYFSIFRFFTNLKINRPKGPMPLQGAASERKARAKGEGT